MLVEHSRGVGDRLAAAQLGTGLVDDQRIPAELRHADGEAGTGAGGGLVEQHGDGLRAGERLTGRSGSCGTSWPSSSTCFCSAWLMSSSRSMWRSSTGHEVLLLWFGMGAACCIGLGVRGGLVVAARPVIVVEVSRWAGRRGSARGWTRLRRFPARRRSAAVPGAVRSGATALTIRPCSRAQFIAACEQRWDRSRRRPADRGRARRRTAGCRMAMMPWRSCSPRPSAFVDQMLVLRWRPAWRGPPPRPRDCPRRWSRGNPGVNSAGQLARRKRSCRPSGIRRPRPWRKSRYRE